MSRSLNKVMLIGNLTKDPVIRYTGKGAAVASISIATNRSWVNSETNEKVDEVEFHNLVVWRKLAEICEKYLKKGDQAFFEGRLQTRKWQGEDGNDRYSTEVVVDNMLMLGGRGGGSSYQQDDDDGYAQASSQKSTSSKKKSSKNDDADSQVKEVEDISDDIPF